MPEMGGEPLGKLIHSNPDFAEIKLIMMSYMNSPNAKDSIEAEVFSEYLFKPVKESRLRECFQHLFPSNQGFEPTENSVKNEQTQSGGKTVNSSNLNTNQSNSAVPNESENQATSNDEFGLKQDSLNQKIMIVEDNAINQKVLRHQLKCLGYKHITIAANGQEALDFLESVNYDLVLMDCQMPILDGYDATELLREREGSTKHTVIIAMTGHAMKGDREKCLEAGMDDYLTKPLNVDKLAATLKRWSNFSTMQLATQEKDLPDIKGLINMERFEDISGGDLEFQKELLQAYLEDMIVLQKQLHEAIAFEDFMAIKHQAHTIKGASSNIGISLIEEIAATLENKAQEQGSLSILISLVKEFETALATIEDLISRKFNKISTD